MPSYTVIGLTAGDPAGIGPEITVKCLRSRRFPADVKPVLFADRAAVEQACLMLGVRLALTGVGSRREALRVERGVAIVPTGALDGPVKPGRVDAACGRSGHRSILNAADWALRGEVDGIATAPIQKEALRLGGCRELDHTGILKAATGATEETTLFVTGPLRVFFLTRHCSLAEVPRLITAESILSAVPRCIDFLGQLGIRRPRLAVAALNPHAGEGGMFGDEEARVIAPAVAELRAAGFSVAGPIPADSVFHLAAEGRFDGVLSLYHDQGHIATKTLDFRRTVSLTMGLPFLRTSVDHGTAFDIAGRGIADETGMIEAVIAAGLHAKRVRRMEALRAGKRDASRGPAPDRSGQGNGVASPRPFGEAP
jgi:4-phospho-D-threonate 3-dehydrogenase / 4-phospho-D-erythronate 3-dehydrogenase